MDVEAFFARAEFAEERPRVATPSAKQPARSGQRLEFDFSVEPASNFVGRHVGAGTSGRQDADIERWKALRVPVGQNARCVVHFHLILALNENPFARAIESLAEIDASSESMRNHDIQTRQTPT